MRSSSEPCDLWTVMAYERDSSLGRVRSSFGDEISAAAEYGSRSGNPVLADTVKLHLRKLVETGRLRLLGRGRGSWYESV